MDRTYKQRTSRTPHKEVFLTKFLIAATARIIKLIGVFVKPGVQCGGQFRSTNCGRWRRRVIRAQQLNNDFLPRRHGLPCKTWAHKAFTKYYTKRTDACKQKATRMALGLLLCLQPWKEK